MAKKPKPPKTGKSSFKKFKNRLSFLIILAFAAFVFYVGWIQIRIPEGHYALVYTKTGGYDRQLIAPGQFVWRWENLFPQNLTLHFLQLKTEYGTMVLDAYLPSGKLYGEAIHHPDAFHYSMELEYHFSLNKDALDDLLIQELYDSDSLPTLYDDYRSRCNRLIREKITEDLDKGGFSLDELDKIEKELIRTLEEQNPNFVISDLKINSYSFPDWELYEISRQNFIEELEQMRKIDFLAEQQSAQIEDKTLRKMDLLKQYGEILTEYPVLLEYCNWNRINWTLPILRIPKKSVQSSD